MLVAIIDKGFDMHDTEQNAVLREREEWCDELSNPQLAVMAQLLLRASAEVREAVTELKAVWTMVPENRDGDKMLVQYATMQDCVRLLDELRDHVWTHASKRALQQGCNDAK